MYIYNVYTNIFVDRKDMNHYAHYPYSRTLKLRLLVPAIWLKDLVLRISKTVIRRDPGLIRKLILLNRNILGYDTPQFFCAFFY